eukprot:699210-Rhodomonas_salina.1
MRTPKIFLTREEAGRKASEIGRRGRRWGGELLRSNLPDSWCLSKDKMFENDKGTEERHMDEHSHAEPELIQSHLVA